MRGRTEGRRRRTRKESCPTPRAPVSVLLDMPLLVYLLLALLLLLLFLLTPDRRIRRCGQLIPGPRPYPLVGNLHELGFGYEGAQIYLKLREKYGDVIRYWIGYKLAVLLSDPDDAEILFRDTQNLAKSDLYKFFHPWLGTGLLTSTGFKWHLRRKAITPTFHFKVLEQFIEVFERKSRTFVKCLAKVADGKVFDVHPLVSRFSLDVICESAMGTSLNAQTDDEPYVDAIRCMCNLVTHRFGHVWLHPDFLFKVFGYGTIQKKALSVIHGFAKKVMSEKEKKIAYDSANLKKADDELGIKKKTAFLELLMKMRADENSAFKTEEDIREEVDTFMFECYTGSTLAASLSELSHIGALSNLAQTPWVAGSLTAVGLGGRRPGASERFLDEFYQEPSMSTHRAAVRLKLHRNNYSQEATTGSQGHDTTASAISFALYSLGMNPGVQAKAYAEAKEVFEKHDGPLTLELLNNLSYLERVIKETLRLYPSVPLIAREISQDIDLPSGYKIPAGTIVGVAIGGIHLNHKYYPEPDKFDPDRFLPENIADRHPYSYVPFSAGPRNCIGQKFAMLEMKACLSQVLLNYEIGSGECVMPGMIITLQSDNGIQILLKPRQALS